MWRLQEIDRKWKNRHSLTTRELSEFSRNLGIMLQAGIPLAEVLEVLSQEPGISRKIRRIYRHLLEALKRGTLLSAAMRENGRTFPELMTEMVYAAEAAGSLGKTALELAEHYDQESRINSRMKSAVLYPKIVAAVLVAVTVLLFSVVLPSFSRLFSFIEEFPLSTRILFRLEKLVRTRWTVILIFLFAGMMLWKGIKQVKTIRREVDKWKLYIPVMGNLLQTIYTARFARTISALYQAGIPAAEALVISGRTTGNLFLEEETKRAERRLKSGISLSQAMEGTRGFLRKLPAVLRIGEEAGSLDKMLSSMADSLEAETEQRINRLLICLEPVFIILMAAAVGFVMAAVLLPIYQSYNEIERLGQW